jgi:hypothetical protein
MDRRLFIWSGYRVPAGAPIREPEGVDRLEGGEPTGPDKVGVGLLTDGVVFSSSGGSP